MLRIPEFEEAIIGPALVWQNNKRVGVMVYDAEEIRRLLMEREGMDFQEAREYIELTIEGGYFGDDSPVIVWRYDQPWMDY